MQCNYFLTRYDDIRSCNVFVSVFFKDCDVDLNSFTTTSTAMKNKSPHISPSSSSVLTPSLFVPLAPSSSSSLSLYDQQLVELLKENRSLAKQRFDRDMELGQQEKEMKRTELLVALARVDGEKKRLELEQQKLNTEMDKIALQSKLCSQRFELEKIERLNQIKTQEAILKLLFRK